MCGCGWGGGWVGVRGARGGRSSAAVLWLGAGRRPRAARSAPRAGATHRLCHAVNDGRHRAGAMAAVHGDARRAVGRVERQHRLRRDEQPAHGNVSNMSCVGSSRWTCRVRGGGGRGVGAVSGWGLRSSCVALTGLPDRVGYAFLSGGRETSEGANARVRPAVRASAAPADGRRRAMAQRARGASSGRVRAPPIGVAVALPARTLLVKTGSESRTLPSSPYSHPSWS